VAIGFLDWEIDDELAARIVRAVLSAWTVMASEVKSKSALIRPSADFSRKREK
jgi:hypothetical protein